MAQPTRTTEPDDHSAAGTQERIIAGAMSGTSADGVDVALVAIAGRGVEMTARLLHHHHRPYEPGLRQAIFHVRETGVAGLAVLATLGRQISLAYSRAVKDALAAASLRPADLACVAAHGQTLYHAPPDTIQWLDPAPVAAEVGCTVVSDFRRADCAAGGQGAPLVPFADYVLFRHATKNRVLLNIGGIANLTWLPAGAGLNGWSRSIPAGELRLRLSDAAVRPAGAGAGGWLRPRRAVAAKGIAIPAARQGGAGRSVLQSAAAQEHGRAGDDRDRFGRVQGRRPTVSIREPDAHGVPSDCRAHWARPRMAPRAARPESSSAGAGRKTPS